MSNTLTYMIITIIIVSGLSIGMFSFFTTLSDKYSAYTSEPISQDQINMINKINYTNRIAQDITDPLKKQLESTKEKNILEQITDVFIGGVVTAVMFFLNIPIIIISFFDILMAPISAFVGGWVSLTIGMIITFMIVVIIIKTIMKWDF
jgi:hypothetical protein